MAAAEAMSEKWCLLRVTRRLQDGAELAASEIDTVPNPACHSVSAALSGLDIVGTADETMACGRVSTDPLRRCVAGVQRHVVSPVRC